jgi:hypothetical protein
MGFTRGIIDRYVYAKGLLLAAGKYKYRVKTVKGGVTQIKDSYSSVEVNPYNAITSPYPSLNIAAATGDAVACVKAGIVNADGKVVFGALSLISGGGVNNDPRSLSCFAHKI